MQLRAMAEQRLIVNPESPNMALSPVKSFSISLTTSISSMTETQLLDLYRQYESLLEGHFLLSSGKHSSRYLQSAKVLSHPEAAEQIGEAIGALFTRRGIEIDLVVGPAMGAVIVAHEVGRALKTPAFFTEREGGAMTLRRGFAIPQGARVLLVEDVVTTGKSTRETIEVVEGLGGKVVAVGSIIDRSGGKADFGGRPFHAIAQLEIPVYDPSSCPLCAAGGPAPYKPGSRPTA